MRSGQLPSDAQAIFSGQAQVWVAASPEEVYDLVSNLARMGEFSPECYRVQWLAGAATPAVGARARGWNKFGPLNWSRVVEVLVANPGREFTFQTVPEWPLYQDSTIWRYQFQPQDGGTLVRESYQIIMISRLLYVFEKVTHRPDLVPKAMQETLKRVKAVAERSPRT